MPFRPHRWLAACACTLLPAAAFAQSGPAPSQSSTQPSETGQTRNPANPAVTGYPAEAAGDGASANGYNPSRWAEDWRRMKDPAKRDDPLDRLKYLPIADEGRVYLTLSGELRLRMNLTTNPNLRKSEAQRQDINRIVGGADLHIGPHFRVYGELAHGGIDGENLGVPAATLRNDLILLQAFGEATATVGSVDVGARYGRQEFTDGPNLLTSARDNNTIHFVLNGVRAWARGKTLRGDAFDFELTRYGPGGTGDDKSDAARRFSGITGGVVLPPGLFGGSKLFLDPYVWRLRSRDAVWGATTAREERSYVGARLWGEAGPVTLDWTVNHQGGSYDGRTIDAWQAFLAQTYKLGSARTAPRIGFHADYASGGGSFGTGKLKAAFAPFGNNIYYSYALFLTPTNLQAIAPNFTFEPLKGVRLTLEHQWTWRPETDDAVYRANGTALPGTQLVGGHRVGTVARAQLVWSITPRLSFTGRLEHLDAGPALRRAGLSDSAFAAGWISFRF